MIDMKRTGEWLIGTLRPEDEGITIGELLRERWKLPKKQVHLLFQHKEIRLDDQAVPQHTRTEAGQIIELRVCLPELFGLEPVKQSLDVLYEDDHLLIVNKPAGLLLHPTLQNQPFTLDHLVAGHFLTNDIAAKVRHVHRLDQETSGAVLYAKHALASALLDERLRVRQINRTYVAFVHGVISSERGTINEPLGKDRHHPSRRRVTAQGELAITHYRVLRRYREATKLECSLETGRTHQIRVHLSHSGYPLVGDSLYGGKAHGIDRQALHAQQLRLIHPFGERDVDVTAAWPDDLKRLEASLERSPTST